MECLEAVWRRGRRRGGQLRVRARPLLTFGSPLERSALGRAGRRRRLLFIHLASNYRHYFIQFIALFNVIQTDRELDGNYFDLLLLFFLSLFLSFFPSFLPFLSSLHNYLNNLSHDFDDEFQRIFVCIPVAFVADFGA